MLYRLVVMIHLIQTYLVSGPELPLEHVDSVYNVPDALEREQEGAIQPQMTDNPAYAAI